MRTRLFLLAGLALALAGCGGTATPGAGGDGAAEVPASALAFVTIDTDLSSSQWKRVGDLLDKFPGKTKLLAQLRQSFESDTKASWERDVKPALGDELDGVVIDLNGKTEAVGLTRPKDAGKFKALLEKLDASDPDGSPTVTDTFHGWTVFADAKAKLDAFEQAAGNGTRLADDKQYQDAISRVDGDALAKVYVNGPKVAQKLGAFLQQSGRTGGVAALRNLRFGAAELLAEDDGLKFFGDAKTSGKVPSPSYSPALLKVVPAGALAFVSFKGSASTAGAASSLGFPALGVRGVDAMFQALSRLGPLFGGENALYVLPGAPFPEVTLLATPKKSARGTAAIDRLVASLKPLLGGVATIHETELDGVPARMLDFGRFSIYYGEAAGHVFVSSSNRIVTELRGGGPTLADDATFKDAEQAAGVGGSTSGLLYVNLKDSIPLVESFAQLSGAKLPPDLDANIRHLRTFLVFADAKTNEAKVTGFLEIK